MIVANRACFIPGLLVLVCMSLPGCDRSRGSEGERLARENCSSCHAFPEPQLLDKKTWETGVLPQMGHRLGVHTKTLFEQMSRDTNELVSAKPVAEKDWQKIVEYYLSRAPYTLPSQSLPAQPRIDPDLFKVSPFVRRLSSTAIITLLKTDSVHERLFIGEAGSNMLRVFDWNRRLISTLTLGSPPTDVLMEGEHVLVLESGILDPNDQPKGSLVQYDFAGDSLRSAKIVIDSLYRPVFAGRVNFDRNGSNEFLVCEYGNNRGRLALYKYNGSRYVRQVLDPTPGAIRFEIRDMTGDGAPDIIALFAQADERIVLFENDGKGNFSGRQRILARFPPVYGSTYFSLHDFNGDGWADIVYVNGDNFDYSRVLKPYHGVRILENDGKNNFHERFFFPIYGAARAEVADFDKDGDLDILATSNFPDAERHPERAIMFLENAGQYEFRSYAFTIGSGQQWNLMTTADLNRDGWLDILVGAMDLGNITRLQGRTTAHAPATSKDAILVFENRMRAKSGAR